MPKTLNEWINENRGQPQTGEENFLALQEMSSALNALHDNLVDQLAKENPVTLQLSEMSRSLLSLAEQSNTLVNSAPEIIQNADVIIEDEDELADDDNIINTSSNRRPAAAQAAPDAAMKWDQAVNSLAGINLLLQENYKEMISSGAADNDAQRNVDMNAIFGGLELLNKFYGIEVDLAPLRKEYDDRQKATDLRPQNIMHEFRQNYEKPIELAPEYLGYVQGIDDALSDIHTGRLGINIEAIEISSDEHSELAAAAERLKRAFADPDIWNDPAEKIAALEQAKQKALAYRKQKRDDEGVIYSDETARKVDEGQLTAEELERGTIHQTRSVRRVVEEPPLVEGGPVRRRNVTENIEEDVQIFRPGSTAGQKRYDGAKKLIDAVNAINSKYQKELEAAKKDLENASKGDAALVNNRKLLRELNRLDDDLNAKRFAGLFSGSSTAHDNLKNSVAELKKALDPKDIRTARTDKLEALKKAKEMAEKYIEKNAGAGSDMGRTRLDAAEKILQIANDELAVVQNAMTVKDDFTTNFKKWSEERKRLLGDEDDKKQMINNEEPAKNEITKAKAKALDGLFDNAERLVDLEKYIDGFEMYSLHQDSTITAESTLGNKLTAVRELIASGNKEATADATFYKERQKLQNVSAMFTQQEYKDIFKACEKATAQENFKDKEIVNYGNVMYETLANANLFYGAKFDLVGMKKAALDAHNELVQEAAEKKAGIEARKKYLDTAAKSQQDRVKDWSERFPCDLEDIEDYEITDPKVIEDVKALDKFSKDIEALRSETFIQSFNELAGADKRIQFTNLMIGVRSAAYNGDDLRNKQNLEDWKELLPAIDELKAFLAEGNNYDLLVQAAKNASEKDAEGRLEFTDFRKSLDGFVKGMNKFHDTKIPERELDTSRLEAEIKMEQPADLDAAVRKAQQELKDMNEEYDMPAKDEMAEYLKTIIAANILKVQKPDDCDMRELRATADAVGDAEAFDELLRSTDPEILYSQALSNGGANLFSKFRSLDENPDVEDEIEKDDNVLDDAGSELSDDNEDADEMEDDDNDLEEEDILESTLKDAQDRIKQNQSAAKKDPEYSPALDLKTVIAVNLIKRQKWENVVVGEIMDVRNSLDHLPEYESMQQNVPEDTQISYALDGDGGRLFDSFMSQRNVLKAKGKNITKDDYHKQKRAEMDMDSFI